jgi:hypothetical protein
VNNKNGDASGNKGGRFVEITAGVQTFIIPHPELRIDDTTFSDTGVGALYDCVGFEPEKGQVWNDFVVEKPAEFSINPTNGRAELISKGTLTKLGSPVITPEPASERADDGSNARKLFTEKGERIPVEDEIIARQDEKLPEEIEPGLKEKLEKVRAYIEKILASWDYTPEDIKDELASKNGLYYEILTARTMQATLEAVKKVFPLVDDIRVKEIEEILNGAEALAEITQLENNRGIRGDTLETIKGLLDESLDRTSEDEKVPGKELTLEKINSLIAELLAEEEEATKEKEELDQEIAELKKLIREEEERIEGEEKEKAELIQAIEADRKSQPWKEFDYLVAEKILPANPLYQVIRNNNFNLLDLRSKDTPDRVLGREFKHGTPKALKESIFGFLIVEMDAREIPDTEQGGMKTDFDNSIYRIIGPDGTILADEVNGYSAANHIFNTAQWKYEDELAEEFSQQYKERQDALYKKTS